MPMMPQLNYMQACIQEFSSRVGVHAIFFSIIWYRFFQSFDSVSYLSNILTWPNLWQISEGRRGGPPVHTQLNPRMTCKYENLEIYFGQMWQRFQIWLLFELTIEFAQVDMFDDGLFSISAQLLANGDR